MYDKDNSGSIELAEMIEIIGTLYEMEGVSKVFWNAIFNMQLYEKNIWNLKCIWLKELSSNNEIDIILTNIETECSASWMLRPTQDEKESGM